MGTSRSAQQFVARINQAATATERHQRNVLIGGAQATKQILLTSATSAGLRPGGTIAGKKWNVRYDLKADHALVRFTGPFHLVENATKAHEITPRAGRQQGKRNRRRGARALLIGGNVRASASHPGTRGKKVFAKGKVVAGRTVPKSMAAEYSKVWGQVFG